MDDAAGSQHRGAEGDGGAERAAGMRGAPDRVSLSQAQTRTTVRLALSFIVAALIAAALANGWWLTLHLFLAGTIVLAISGVSLMLTVTWSAAPAPPNRWVAMQRLCIATGAAAVGLGRQARWPDSVVGTAGALYLAGLVLLAWLLLVTVRQSVVRRFDVAVAAYVVALAAGTTGVAIGVVMTIGTPSAGLRDAHVTINLLGLLGLVIAGTMPFFSATVGRSRVSPQATPRRLASILGWQAAALLVAVVALTMGAGGVAAIGLGGYALGVIAVLAMLPRPTRRQLRWAGPRLAALWIGGAWWAIAVALTAIDAAANRAVFGGRWLVVLVIAGYTQILWGSLAYLLPMLRGGGSKRLGEGFAATRSWLGFGAVNLGGLSAAFKFPTTVTVAAVAVWVVDSAWRAARVGTARANRPTQEPA